jgi:ABC-type iron transport system FetAB ATPase subunit
LIASNGKKLKEEIDLASRDVELYSKVAITLASIGESRQAAAQQMIEELVTRGLQGIFENKDMEFQVMQTHRGKSPEVKFLIKSRGLNGRAVETDIMDARGGGLAAVVGFLLRLVVMLLDSKVKEPILILDESFSHVSAEYERPLVQFILQLVEKTNAQIVLVTHHLVDAFMEVADRRYRTTLVDGVTKLEEI